MNAKHALYRADGKWYHALTNFPGALFDANGYVLFKTRRDYESCHNLQIRQDVHVPNGIASIPGYVAVVMAQIADATDLPGALTEAAELTIEARAGFRLSAAERRMIESYAVERAIAYFTRQGYSVTNVSSAKCYDLSCWKNESELCVEVKGTTTRGSQIVLTRNEVNLQATRALFIVHSIQFVTRQPSGGIEKVIVPWLPEDHRLTVINWMYEVP